MTDQGPKVTVEQVREVLEGLVDSVQEAYPGIGRLTAIELLQQMAKISANGWLKGEAFKAVLRDRVREGLKTGEPWASHVGRTEPGRELWK